MKIPVIGDAIKNYIILGMGGVILVMGAAIGYQTHQVTKTKLSLQTEKNARATETIERQNLVIEYQDKLAKKELDHAAEQQTKDEAFRQKLKDQQTQFAADRVVNKRLLDAAETRAASYRAAGSTDSASCKRLADRAIALDGLVAEGKGLVDEGRTVVAERDAAVVLLLDVIKNDRAACTSNNIRQ